MKQVLSIILQTLLLFFSAVAGFAAGAVLPSLRLSHVLSQTFTSIRTYDFDWLAAVLLVYALLLLIGALRRRIRTAWLGSTIALVVTILIVVLFTKIGLKDTPL